MKDDMNFFLTRILDFRGIVTCKLGMAFFLNNCTLHVCLFMSGWKYTFSKFACHAKATSTKQTKKVWGQKNSPPTFFKIKIGARDSNFGKYLGFSHNAGNAKSQSLGMKNKAVMRNSTFFVLCTTSLSVRLWQILSLKRGSVTNEPILSGED